MTPEQADDLARRILAVIDTRYPAGEWREVYAADRERVASDLAAIRDWWACQDSDYLYALPKAWLNYAAANLVRTAALYEVE